MILQLSDGMKSFGGPDLLDHADFQIKEKEKIGLVGRNGCGKTTLLKILSGEESLDSGQLIIPKNVRVAALSQITFEDLSQSCWQALSAVFADVIALEKDVQGAAQALKSDASKQALEKYDRLHNAFESMGGYTWQTELRTMFFSFHFSEEDLFRPLSEFSSGQRTRIGLAKLLLSKPDVLLLDEPTNHLDMDSIEWLEGYIRKYPKAVVVVSHDRTFLDRVCDQIADMEFGKIKRWSGNYTQFLEQKALWLERNQEAYARQQAQIARLEALIERFHAKASKASFAKAKAKELERMDKVELASTDKSKMRAHFQSGRKSGNDVLKLEDLTVGYDRPLTRLSLEVKKGERIGIVGPNGIGKSTLIKTLAGLLPKLSGDFLWGHHADVGYFSQDSAQEEVSDSVLETLWKRHPIAQQGEIRRVLASFLFTQDEVFKDAADLSGGERVRLALAVLMMDHDNVLLLDEPTNHLDIPARESLEEALADYDGTVIFVSHDRMFLSKTATRIVEIEPWKKEDGKKVEKSQPVLNHGEQKVLKNRVAKLEKLLEEAESHLGVLEEKRFEPEWYSSFEKSEELEKQIADQKEKIQELMEEWEAKMEQLEA